MKQGRSVLFWALVAVLSVSSLLAQVTGRLTGSVVDSSGAAIPGAAVNVFLTGGSRPVLTGSTSSDGLFSFSGVQAGTYDLVIDATGFAKSVIRAVKIDPARETAIPAVKMEVQAVSQTLEVTSAAEAVQTGNIEISNTVTQTQVQTLPVLDRQVSTLFLTQPGVTSGRGPTTVNGLRTSMANVTLDGINVQDNFVRTNALDYIPAKFTIEQVAELTVTTSNSNAATGGGVAQMTMVTPSGGNRFHGSAYWYNRNSALSANDWFNNRNGVGVPFLNQNQLGGSLGGPIRKDKLFFYFNYEAFRLKQQTPINRTVLTPSARNGIFTWRDSGGNLKTANLLQMRNAQIDPAMKAILGNVPTAINNYDLGDGLNTAGYSFNARDNEDRNAVTARVDYVLSPKHNISGTYVWNTDKVDRSDLANDFNAIPPIFNDNHSRLMSFAWRWSPLPSLTNELRGGFNLAPGTFNNTDSTYPQYLLASTSLIFSNPVNQWMQQGRDTNTYSYQDNANFLRGRHNVYFGFQSQLIRTAPYNDAGIIPSYTLGISSNNTTGFAASELAGIQSSDLNTANSLYTDLAGIVSSYTQTFNIKDRTSGFVNGQTNLRHFTYDNYSAYVQDNYRVLPRLTVNLGVRYEYFTQLNERDGLILLPQLVDNNFITTLLSNSTLDFAGGSTSHPFYNPDRNNFAPNAGFAWDVFGNGRTAIRGGYSISYVNDDTITAIRNNVNTSSGLVGNVSKSGLVANLSGAPAVPVPAFQVPRTFLDNYNLDPNSAFGLPDPSLRVPYVQQWSFGIQQEIKGTVIEGRYVGNHGTKELRAFDYNQVIIKENGFLDDFNRARANGFASMSAGRGFDPRYNSAVPGSVPLTIFPTMENGGYLTNSSVLTYIRQGEPGTLGQFYQVNAVNDPVNFFRNPYALGTNTIANYSNSTYNAFQLDVRHRSSKGLYYQFNYTFSKALGDGTGDGQTRFEPFLDNNNPGIERAREPNDLTHVLKANFSYELPFGRGKRFSAGPAINRVIGGWTASGVWIYTSGTPFSILSTRGTLNRGGRSTENTASTSLNKDQLDEAVGFFMTGNGPYFVKPSFQGGPIGSDGRGVASDGSAPFNGQVFYNPAAGTVGSLQRRYFNGPWDFMFDASVQKRIPITEGKYLELRAESFNAINHPAFYVGDETSSNTRFNINQATFGKVTSTINLPRVMQFGLYFKF